MSQSGTTISPRRRLLKATEAICKVWNVGSLVMKSSDALATAFNWKQQTQWETTFQLGNIRLCVWNQESSQTYRLS